MSNGHFLLRRLAGSDLGWFAAPRKAGKAKGNQRGINFNAVDMERIFPAEILASGEVPVISERLSDGQTQQRRIRLQEKNWRLVGDMVSGQGLDLLEEGDFMWVEVQASNCPPYRLVWDVVTARGNPELQRKLQEESSLFLRGGMASWSSDDPLSEHFALLAGRLPDRVSPGAGFAGGAAGGRREQQRIPTKMLSRPLPASPKVEVKRRKRIEDRLRRPHILAQIVKTGMVLSAKAQADFIDVLDALSDELRSLVLEAGLIRTVEINHQRAWSEFKGRTIGFVDGGVANVDALGAAPLAIRVGSYLVTPGKKGPGREEFTFEIQLVDELYDSSPGSGIFADWFEDVGKLRDAARICCEVAGLVSLGLREPSPDIVLLHGPLVNPVSPYALGIPGQADAFPNFTAATLGKLLPHDQRIRAGREANFVSVYLEQLNALASGSATVCGVVERASPTFPGPLIRRLLEQFHGEGRIDGPTLEQFRSKLYAYRITDSVIFECLLNEGEYVEPIEVDKQEPHSKIPVPWMPEITAYPKPLITYVKSSAETMPVRVEAFRAGSLTPGQLMKLIVHTSRLLPRYAFPVGLDIVDKHAKVPEWMSRQMNAMLSAQLMKKAMEAGNPAAIGVVKRMLSTNTRDWLFRPDFRRG